MNGGGLRRLLALTCAVVLVDTTFFAAITPLLPHYVDEFSLSKTGAGVLAGAYAAGTGLGALPAGLLAARAGVKPTVLLGLASLALSSLAFAFAPSETALVGARFVQGFGGAASWAGSLAWLVGAAPAQRRGEVIGAAFAAAITGGLLGPVLGGVAQLTTPEATFSAVAVLAVLLAIWAARTPAARPERPGRLADVGHALRDRRVATGMWLIAVPGLLFGALGVLAPLRLDALGASGLAVAAIWLVAAGFEAIVSPVVGRVSDRRGRRGPLMFALGGSAVCYLLLPLPDALAPLVALVLITAPVIGILWAPASALLSDGAEAVGLHQGFAFALLNLGWALGQVTGSSGGGALAQATSDAVPYLLLAGLCAATLAAVARALAPAAALVLCTLAACGGSSEEAPAQSHPASAPPPAAGTARRAGRLRLVSIGRFDSPLYVTAPPGDRRRVFIVEQGGRIRVVRGGRTLPTPFLDIGDQVTAGGEQGLLGLAFAPDYARSGRFYVYFTGKDAKEHVVEYHRASADRADGGSARVLMVMDDPEPNHNGGQLAFGPDRLLYIGTGDGGGGNDQHGSRGNAQNLGSLLGKILRIDPRAGGGRPYRIPPSNPFVKRAGARGEIYAYGLRNPWRFSFDRRTGDLSIGDVGQDTREEVDFVRKGRGKGANFGWRPFEGDRRNFDEPAPGARRPAFDYGRADGSCSVTGGYVVRDRGVPSLSGRYVYGDYCAGRLFKVTLRANGARNRAALPLAKIDELSSFGEDARGRLYVTSLGSGGVWRFAQ